MSSIHIHIDVDILQSSRKVKEFQCGEAPILIMDDGAENALLMLMASVLAMEPAKRVLSLAR